MIEPPGDLRRWRVLEVDDGVLIAGKFMLVEQRSSAMKQPDEFKTGVVANALAVKTREQRRGRSTVKALVVKEDPDPQNRSWLLAPGH